jgi:ABC-2 type transport system ATP-binding protein
VSAVIELERCSKWYGHVLGVSEVTWRVGGGVVGLLGPNGAGKSTLIKMISGLMRPSRGAVRVYGEAPFSSPAARARIGYCPEHEGRYGELTALEMVAAMAELSGLDRRRARSAAAASLEQLGMAEAAHRRVAGFSKGMVQRTKLAQALVHDPDLVILDEPLTGVDPVGRAEIAERVRALGKAGKTVLISSHVLHEVEAITEEILVIYQGQVLAEGNLYKIRELIDRHPHRIRIECDRPRELAAAVAGAEHLTQISYERHGIVIETRDPDHAYDLIARTSLESGLAIRSLTSTDNNLDSVFAYLTGGRR